MRRYIDAERLIDDIRPFAEYDSNRSNKDWVRRFEIAIEAQPTADVVEVVRCKDCKYDHKCSHNIIRPSKGGGIIYCPLEYCSEGERKYE